MKKFTTIFFVYNASLYWQLLPQYTCQYVVKYDIWLIHEDHRCSTYKIIFHTWFNVIYLLIFAIRYLLNIFLLWLLVLSKLHKMSISCCKLISIYFELFISFLKHKPYKLILKLNREIKYRNLFQLRFSWNIICFNVI